MAELLGPCADAQTRWGKLNTINDFCTGPAQNWIGLVHNSRGDVLSKGCSKCHAGLGLKPELSHFVGFDPARIGGTNGRAPVATTMLRVVRF